MTRLLIVDLDDTLVDRNAVLREWANEIAAERPDLPGLASWITEFDRDGDRVRDRAEFLDGVASRVGWIESSQALLSRWPGWFGARYRLVEVVADALAQARDVGCRVVVVTNGDEEVQNAKIAAMGLRERVDGCVVSGEVGVRKPDPRIFAMAAESGDTDLRDAWVIGDDPVADIGGGWAAGAMPLWVNHASQPWPTKLRPPYQEFCDATSAIRFASNLAGADQS